MGLLLCIHTHINVVSNSCLMNEGLLWKYWCLVGDRSTVCHKCATSVSDTQLQTVYILWSLWLIAIWSSEAGTAVWRYQSITSLDFMLCITDFRLYRCISLHYFISRDRVPCTKVLAACCICVICQCTFSCCKPETEAEYKILKTSSSFMYWPWWCIMSWFSICHHCV